MKLLSPALVLLAAGAIAVAPAAGVPEQAPKRGGTVIHGGPFQEFACFTPVLDACAPGSSGLPLGFITVKVLEAPYDVGPDQAWRPRLVTHVDVREKRPFTLTYHIRPQARWSDGVPVSAGDFVFTHQTLVKHRPPGSDDPHRTHVRSIRAVGPKTVRVVLAEPFAEWQGLFGSVLPAHALRGQDLTEIWRNGIDDPRTGKAIGSGPFLVERWERGRQVVLRRNPNYWGPHPAHIDRVVVRFALSPEAAAEQFRSGALDLATHFAPTTAVALAQERGVRLLSNQTGAGWDHLEFRVREGGHPALRSKLVRRAIAYGVDRAAIVEQVVSKAAVNARQRDSAIFPRQDPRYEPSWARYTRRPALARRLLVRAGCTLGADGVRACDGRRLSLRLATTVIAGGFRPDVVQLIQRQLGPLGVEILPEFYPSVAIFGPLFRRGQFDIVLFAWVGTPDRAFGAKLIFGCGGADNVTGYCQRIVTDDLDRALGALDPGKQARVLNRVDKRLASDVPVLPLYQQTQTMVVRATVRGFGSALNMQLSPLWNAEDWWLAPSR